MNVPQLVQESLAVWLKAQSLGDIPAAQVYRGIQHDDATEPKVGIKYPCVICNCEASDFTAQFSGNQSAIATVEIISNADDTSHETHKTRVDTVLSFLLTTTIAADLSAAIEDFTAFLVIPNGEGNTRGERSWRSFINLNIICAPSRIT